MAKIFGSYIGEVIRRNHKAKWAIIKSNGTERASMYIKGQQIFPLEKTFGRITNGEEDNIWHYFLIITNNTNINQFKSGSD